MPQVVGRIRPQSPLRHCNVLATLEFMCMGSVGGMPAGPGGLKREPPDIPGGTRARWLVKSMCVVCAVSERKM